MSIATTKVCRKCGVEQDVGCFWVAPKNKDGLQGKCKDCQRVESREYKRKNREKLNAALRQKRKDNPDYQRAFYLKSMFGISLEQYNEMLARQNGCCAICFERETAIGRNGVVQNLAVDHCHETGKVRALLCKNCNIALGLLKDNSDLIKRAASYIEEHS